MSLLSFKARADAWVARNLLWIVLVGVVVVAFSFGMVNYYGDKLEQQAVTNPPLPAKVAKKIRGQSKAAEAQAEAYKFLAQRRAAQRDSALRAARKSKRQADSLLSLREKLPASSTGPLPAIVLDLRTYQSPDTSR